LKHLKQFNEQRRVSSPRFNYVFATEHLPKQLQLQKKKLVPLFKAAREENKKTVWKVEDCEYRLYIDGEQAYA